MRNALAAALTSHAPLPVGIMPCFRDSYRPPTTSGQVETGAPLHLGPLVLNNAAQKDFSSVSIQKKVYCTY